MRKFSPRELNWLKKYGVFLEEAGKFGEMPVEYITGRAEFRGREFLVTPDVLIPRIETEELIVHSIKLVTSLDKSEIMVADVGTGCGCIGITLYLELIKQGIRPAVYLSDISEKALKVAEKNAFRLVKAWPSDGRPGLIILQSDLFISYQNDLKFDLVIANLPYVPSGRWSKLPDSVRKFEPMTAIDGGKDGTLLIKKLIKQSRKRLVKGGAVILEIDETHSQDTFAIETGKKFKLEIKPDQFAKNRFLILYKK